eukprot:CAMPEP_0118861562 /NCGR_PEP_ID=MMETSP1163-20130328/7048_1 /TAXON_ID=124430 /ORGANISM="Phaeomonas parva, Strain CCMP2877" /LENGTH=275 /DNA_ID=CAMNT_0006795381 /DNA_START=457 /DNA_END=1281 /DNA_ORIENTATION=+
MKKGARAKMQGLDALKAKYAAKLHTVRSKFWSDLVGLHEELVHLTAQLNPGDSGTQVAKDKHAKLKIFLEHVRKAMKALQLIPDSANLLKEDAVDRLEEHISRVLLPIKVRLETLREAMASETLNLAMLGADAAAQADTSKAMPSPEKTPSPAPEADSDSLRKRLQGNTSPDSVHNIFVKDGTSSEPSTTSESVAFSLESEQREASSYSPSPFDVPFGELMDDLDDSSTCKPVGAPYLTEAHGVVVAPSTKRQRMEAPAHGAGRIKTKTDAAAPA